MDKAFAGIIRTGGTSTIGTPTTGNSVVVISPENDTPSGRLRALARFKWPTPDVEFPQDQAELIRELISMRYSMLRTMDLGARETQIVGEDFNLETFKKLTGLEAVAYSIGREPRAREGVPHHPNNDVNTLLIKIDAWLRWAQEQPETKKQQKNKDNSHQQATLQQIANYSKDSEKYDPGSLSNLMKRLSEGGGEGEKGEPQEGEGAIAEEWEEEYEERLKNNPKTDSFSPEEVEKSLPNSFTSQPDWSRPRKFPPRWGRNTNWGAMTIFNPPRPASLPGWMRSRALAPQAAGSIVRHLHRWPTDQAIFATHRKRYKPVNILVDQSGSMSLQDSEVMELMKYAPRAQIAQYMGDGNEGRLYIIAKNGRRINVDPSAYRPYGGNTVDFPALKWLAKQNGPRIWVSDGQVLGRNDLITPAMLQQVARICHVAGIVRIGRPAETIEFMRQKFGRHGAY